MTIHYLVLEHEQSCSGDARRGCSICVPAFEKHSSGDSVGGVHEAYAGEEEEQRETGEEVKGVVAPDSGCTCTALEASGHEEMENEVEIEMSRRAMLMFYTCMAYL